MIFNEYCNRCGGILSPIYKSGDTEDNPSEYLCRSCGAEGTYIRTPKTKIYVLEKQLRNILDPNCDYIPGINPFVENHMVSMQLGISYVRELRDLLEKDVLSSHESLLRYLNYIIDHHEMFAVRRSHSGVDTSR